MRPRLLFVFAACALPGCAAPPPFQPEAPPAPTAPVSSTLFDVSSLVGSIWIAEDIDGRGVIDDLQTKLQFVGGTEVAGFGGCNAFTGRATMSGDALKLGPLAATTKACPPAAMDQESRFFAALEAVRSARVEKGLLHLLDESGHTVLRFSRGS